MAAMSGIATVESFFHALEELAPERALALMSDDVVYENVPLPPARGKRAVGFQLRLLAKPLERFEIDTHHIAERDGVVLTERTDTMVIAGTPIRFWVCGRFEVRDGRITYWRDYFDWAAFTAATACALPVIALRSLCRCRR